MFSSIGRRNSVRVLAAVAGIIAVQACASGGYTADGDGRALPRVREVPGAATVSESARITARELDKLQGGNALDAVRRLRPEYLMMREPAAQLKLSIYQDGTYFGEADLLSLIPVDQVVEIRRLTEVQARQMFGWRCPCDGGVITVQTQR